MKPEWCDSLSTCGSVAEWTSVEIARASLGVSAIATVVAAAGTIAVWYLGRQANKLAKTARDMQDEHDAREGRILFMYLKPSIRAASSSASIVLGRLRQMTSREFTDHPTLRADIARQSEDIQIKNLEAVLDRLHTIGSRADKIMNVNADLRRVTDFAAMLASPYTTDLDFIEKMFPYLIQLLAEAHEELGALLKVEEIAH